MWMLKRTPAVNGNYRLCFQRAEKEAELADCFLGLLENLGFLV